MLKPVLIWVSPSGDGLKMVVKINPSLIEMGWGSKKMDKIWTAVNEYLRRNYYHIIMSDSAGNYIDPSGSDLSRACFLCTDRDAYYNANVDTILDQTFVFENSTGGGSFCKAGSN